MADLLDAAPAERVAHCLTLALAAGLVAVPALALTALVGRNLGPQIRRALAIATALVVVAAISAGALWYFRTHSGFTVPVSSDENVLLVTIVCVALLRGSIPGAMAGFAGGLLVDIGTLGTLGVTALLLTVAGYWAGRYGEPGSSRRLSWPWASVLPENGALLSHPIRKVKRPAARRQSRIV